MAAQHGTTPGDQARIDRRVQAQLDSIAIVRQIINGSGANVELLFETTNHPDELAQAACGLAAAVVAMLEPAQREVLLDGLTKAALADAGRR